MKKAYFYILGILTGIANGLFGSGGGIIAVPLLQKAKIETKKSHATSIALTLPLSIISAIIYSSKDEFDFKIALPLIPAGLVGAIVGGLFLKKIPNKLLRRIFGIILIISGIRLFLR